MRSDSDDKILSHGTHAVGGVMISEARSRIHGSGKNWMNGSGDITIKRKQSVRSDLKGPFNKLSVRRGAHSSKIRFLRTFLLEFNILKPLRNPPG